MNDTLRERAAKLLGIDAKDVSDEKVLDALEAEQKSNEESAFASALASARTTLEKHVERGAVPSGALDARMEMIEAATTARARELMAASTDESWSPLPDGAIPRKPSGSGEEGTPPKPGDEGEPVSALIGRQVEEKCKADLSLSRLNAYEAVVASLTDEQKTAYENEQEEQAAFQRGA